MHKQYISTIVTHVSSSLSAENDRYNCLSSVHKWYFRQVGGNCCQKGKEHVKNIRDFMDERCLFRIFPFSMHTLSVVRYRQGWFHFRVLPCMHSLSDNIYNTHSEKSPARPMLFYSTNDWQQFWVQFVV